ncbi:MAG TPA: EamA family transporter RarD [Thermoanaerobaculia bacterium]|nr:EamA family transporter RarD [Thermoanaerobaculia bacterium]
MTTEQRRTETTGVLFAGGAYVWWGLVAAYFKLIRHVPPLEILAHRIVWSVAMLVLLVFVTARGRAIARILGDRRTLLFLLGSTLLVATNWLVFIIAVTTDRLLDASLGYFINPIVSVFLGFVVLRERLRPLEWVSVALSASAVALLTIRAGIFPWIAVTLALSFGLYGLLRKLARAGAIEGLFVETVILLPAAAVYLFFLSARGRLVFGAGSVTTDLLLIAAGPITALPLVWFAAGVQRLRLATIGLLQYVSPTMQFVLAVVLFREPFQGTRVFAFILIWVAVALYTIANLRQRGSVEPIV